MPSRLSEPHRAPRGGAAWPRTVEELAARLRAPGPSVTRVATERRANVAIHRRLTAAVAAALDA